MTSMEDMLAAMGTKKNIIILDCETTGLDTMNDEILQPVSYTHLTLPTKA